MSEDQKPPLTHHRYDGIEEYDNPLPNWWIMTFLGTIIFGYIYFTHYYFGGGQTQSQELAEHLARLPQVTQKTWNEADLQSKMEAIADLESGKMTYASKCASCHGQKGEGIIGPNLADNFWIHGKGTRVALMKVISEGVLEKGMPAWAGLITDDEMIHVAQLIRTFKGTQPPNPKSAQGEEVQE